MSKKINLLNKKFGKLTVIDEAEYVKNTRVKWLCQCECGNTKIVASKELRNGDTKSCGCLQKITSSKNAQKAIVARTKYIPQITSARTVWRDVYSELDFDDFYKLSQLNCYYCDGSPSNKTNYFENKLDHSNYSKNAIENGLFIYNGLDRIDSNKGHTIDNCVPCCWICNRAKRERSMEEFYIHVANLINNIRIDFDLYRENSIKIFFSKKENTRYVRGKFKSGYNDGNLTLEQFYQLSQLNCYYCGIGPNNKTENFIYNGLDRIDINFPHDYNNVISCCKYCNYAKGNLNISEFYAWINKLKKGDERNSSPFEYLRC